MTFGITGVHGLDQVFGSKEVAPGEFGVTIRQGGDEIILIRLRNPSEAQAQELAAILAERVSSVLTPSVVQAMLEGTIAQG
jgi:hypothetical protein